MKQIFMLVLIAAAGYGTVQEPAQAKPATQKATPKAATKSSKAKTTAKRGPGTIPKDAKEISPGHFRWVDPKGQAWIYTQTPFGIMSGPETRTGPDPIPTDWKVFDEGDSLTFERPWPFSGTKRWTVKKTDLTELETSVWKRAQSESAKQ